MELIHLLYPLCYFYQKIRELFAFSLGNVSLNADAIKGLKEFFIVSFFIPISKQ